jgi:hypothetical protein
MRQPLTVALLLAKLRCMQLAYGINSGGWAEVGDIDGLGDRRLYVRLLPDERGRFSVRELFVTGDEPLSGALLRSLPIEHIEAVVNSMPAEDLGDPYAQPAVQLAVLASFYADTFTDRALDKARRDFNWVVFQYASQFDQIKDVKPVAVKPRNISARPPEEPSPLYRPDGHFLSDEFLDHVAASYRWANHIGRDPAPFLANQANVPERTIHGWIQRARKRGRMPAGQRGKRG